VDLTGRNISANIKNERSFFIGGVMPKVTEEYLETRRLEILEAAITCFIRKGFHQTTIDEICDEAGVSPGAVYRYFASKEEIIQAAVHLGPGSDIMLWIEEETARFDDFRTLIDMFSKVGYQRYEQVENIEGEMKLRLRGWAEALQNPEVKEEVLKRWESHLAISQEIVNRAQEFGQINPELDPRAAAYVFQAVSDGFTLLWTIDPNIDIWKFREVELALYGGTFWTGKKDGAD
jgi:AcrR family transcriptional regulator